MSIDLTFLRNAVRGAVLTDEATLVSHSTDASIFAVRPVAVFVPEDARDLAHAVQAVADARKQGISVSLTARAAGTCMSGGSLTASIQVDCRNLNLIDYAGGDTVRAQPGAFFRDVERTILRRGRIFPSYPASKHLCAIGGMVGNNAGGEKTLRYGKTNKYVVSIDAVLDDGSLVTFKPLSRSELDMKLSLQTREGQLYRDLYALITKHYETIAAARPRVSKNSSGYNLWDIWNPETGTFDVTQLITGAQGTLCLMTDVTLRLVKPHPYSSLTVLFLDDEKRIATLVKELLTHEPESLESFDHHTLGLALRYISVLARHMGKGMLSLGIRFIPEMLMSLIYGMPRLTILVELTDDNRDRLDRRVSRLRDDLRARGIRFRAAGTGNEANKYWAVRRESFSLLREKVRDQQTAPFIDDIVVRPEDLSEFMPRLEELMEEYKQYMTYTIAGHVGDGNFHIIPLMNLHDPEARKAMYDLQDKAIELTLAFDGSTSGEHNDGLIRTHYVERQFGSEVYGLFEEVKTIFDPQNIFNPGKKVQGNWDYAMRHVK